MKRSLWLISLLLVAGVWFLTAQSVQAQSPFLPEGPAGVCTAQETSYRSTFTADKDSYVNNSSAYTNTNYGTNPSLQVGIVTSPIAATYRTLVAFDLSTLPADAVILTATLELSQTYSSSTFGMKAQVLTGAWTEGGVTWNNQPAFTTVGEVSGSVLSDGWRSWNLTTIAQQWRAGTLANHGVRVIFDTGGSGYRTFSSREGADAPRLVVEYVRRTTFTVQADTSIAQAYPTQNYGNSADMTVQRNDSTSYESHALLQFNVSSIPANSTIISATLILHGTVNRALASPQAAIAISPTANLGSWTEMGVTWNNRPGDESQGDPSSTFVDGAFNYWDVANIVQAWSSGALLNYGFRLKPASDEFGSASLAASETAPDPQLIITYGPPPCYPATSVTINGATAGITDTVYTFDASVLPATATPPITYTWQADGQSAVSGQQSAVTYTWATTGTKTITVTVENCEQSVVDTHQIVINAPVPACEFPLTGLTLDGPATGFIETEYSYTATPVPSNATTPITYTWQADEQSAVSGQQSVTYTWATPGTKAITVTAQNCGGTIVQHYSVNVQPRPDLAISSALYNLAEERVYYVIKNVGGGTAPAGHTAQLSRDGSSVASALFDEALAPGAVRADSIPYAWTCAGATAQMRVCADATGILPEDDEANNCFEQTWSCDLVLPQITSGPTVSGIEEQVAVITWTTSEPCRSRLDYSRNGPFNIASITDDTLKTTHQATLSGLESGSLYWYSVAVTDTAGNLNTSSGAFFETLPLGTDPATLGVIGMSEYPSAKYEFWTLYADVTSEVAGVDRVSFFLDGQLIGRDHSPTGSRYEVYVSPAALGLSRLDWFKSHALQVQVYNLENEPAAKIATVTPANRPMPGEAYFVSPDPDKNIYIDGETAPAGTVVNVWATGRQYMWKCTEFGHAEGGDVPAGMDGIVCSSVMQNVSVMRVYLDGTLVDTHYPAAGIYKRTLDVNLAGKAVGNHTLRFEAQTSGGNVYTAERTIRLVQGRGELDFERTATRQGNAIQVTLTIKNIGVGTAYVDYVEDFVRGFQVIEKSNALGLMSPAANYYYVKNGDYGETPERKIMIDLFNDTTEEIALAADESFVVTYQLVPILYPQWEFYYIGSGHAPEHTARVYYHLAGVAGNFSRNFQVGANWVDDIYVDVMVEQIAEGSDYILVTSPARLVAYTSAVDWRTSLGTQRELSLLLSRMAELATYRNAVLGYLPISLCPTTLDALLEPGGYWANALHPNFRTYHAGGYVLFVGEDNIIPSQGAGYDVPYSDLRYASTSGEAKPELVLGRITGNDMGTLRQGLESAIYVARTGSGFDRQRAVLFSGRGSGVDEFWTQLNEVSSRLDFPEVTRLKGKDYDSGHKILEDFRAEMSKGQSLVVFRGHGAYNSWDSTSIGFSAYDVGTFFFNGYHPFAFGITCLSGDYKGGYSMGEAWLRYGAGAFIGAVSPSDRDTNGRAGRGFFNRWGANGALTVGYTFADMARDHWADDGDWRRWIYQYHLYGDPKYGALLGMVRTLALTAPNGPTGAVQITVPDYTVTTDEESWDHVTLPGDREWLKLNDYIVPTWKVSYTYPQGQRVQDVTLTAQSGLTVATGLHIPTATLETDCNCGVAAVQSSAAITGWYPQLEQDYAWKVSDNPDGTSMLELTLYPFTYNPDTTDARFYKNWEFNVTVITATASVVTLQPLQPTFRLTETAAATLVVDNSGAEQMLIVQPTVKSLSDEVETALSLQALHAITGTSLLDLVIMETLAAGDYILDVTLVDIAGHVLDTEVTEFTVGVVEGEVTDLTATPTSFDPGDDIALTMTFQNTGDVTLNGVAIIRVETGDGVTQTAEFTHTLAALLPGATANFNNVWDSTGAISDTYRVVGYVTYNLATSLPKEVILNLATRTSIYLPLVLRSSD